MRRASKLRVRIGQTVYIALSGELQDSVARWIDNHGPARARVVDLNTREYDQDDPDEEYQLGWDNEDHDGNDPGIIAEFLDPELHRIADGGGGAGCNWVPWEAVYVKSIRGQIKFMESNELGDFPKKKVAR